jgi:nitronate monooxygenase
MAASKLRRLYPWVQESLIVSAPMKPFALHQLATEVTLAKGIGFLANPSSPKATRSELSAAIDKLQKKFPGKQLRDSFGTNLPIGIGYQMYQEKLDDVVAVMGEYQPAAAWLFAPKEEADYAKWAESIRNASPDTKIWIQVGSVADALTMIKLCGKDIVVVLQGTDSGGHGYRDNASLISLVPETADALRKYEIPIFAAGGIAEGRAAAAALVLGAHGIVMGTRFLASQEVAIPKAFQQHLLDSEDGGVVTMRSRLFDDLRGTSDFPSTYDGRALVNQSMRDAAEGVEEEEGKRRYQEALKNVETRGYGTQGRLVSYAGTGVGFLKRVQPAAEIVEEVRSGIKESLARFSK